MSEDTGELQAQAAEHIRREGGRWVAGASGNPKGRPRGAKNKTSALCAALLGDEAEAIIKKLIGRAKKGDPMALRLAVERVAPLRSARDRAVDVELPELSAVGDLVQAAAAVVGHAARGELSISQAKEFMGLLEGARRIVDTVQLSERIAELERVCGVSNNGAALGSRADVVEGAARELRLLAEEPAA